MKSPHVNAEGLRDTAAEIEARDGVLALLSLLDETAKNHSRLILYGSDCEHYADALRGHQAAMDDMLVSAGYDAASSARLAEERREHVADLTRIIGTLADKVGNKPERISFTFALQDEAETDLDSIGVELGMELVLVLEERFNGRQDA